MPKLPKALQDVQGEVGDHPGRYEDVDMITIATLPYTARGSSLAGSTMLPAAFVIRPKPS